jgi:hypothetical protein
VQQGGNETSRQWTSTSTDCTHVLLSLINERHDKEAFARPETASSRTWSATHFKHYLYQLVAIAFWSRVPGWLSWRTPARLNAAAEAGSAPPPLVAPSPLRLCSMCCMASV